MTKLFGVQLYGPVEELKPDPYRQEMEQMYRDFNHLMTHIDHIESYMKNPDSALSPTSTTVVYQLGVLKRKLNQFLSGNEYAIIERRNGNHF